ncbi:hypothetical protein [Leucobacter sp. 7(1)]|uniref:hypothetical protein n=1 Tax=Leucobacter sp. 7(1) TaxID=1255613 RepID=UPI00111FB8B7|nr:hypothetical protein [Leucobacter sp. 7(1)]
MESAETSLIFQLRQWDDIRRELEVASNFSPDASSQLVTDNSALATETASLALTRYIYERAYNAVRTLKKLHHLVFDFDPSQIHFDHTTMYPLMRSVIEDSSTISWLLSPEDLTERLTRTLRIFSTENKYFIENLKLLSEVNQASSGGPDLLKNHLDEQKAEMEELLISTAVRLNLELDQVLKIVPTRQPIKDHYGSTSTTFLAWKLLSDLSHFSFMTLRHMTKEVPDYAGAPLNRVTMISLAAAVGRSAYDASQILTSTTAPSHQPTPKGGQQPNEGR